MGYRRSHQRRAHMRTNADGSKSYVKESHVKGHEVRKYRNYSSSSGYSGSGDNWALWLLFWAVLYFIFS